MLSHGRLLAPNSNQYELIDSAELAGTQVSQSSMHLNHQIPRILHQTAKNETIPDIWVDSQESCLTTYSSYEYKLWTDDGARSFLATEYPWFLQVWDNYPFPIQRADAIRYFALYHYGGIYLDMDTICHETFPIEKIEIDDITHNCLFEGTLPTGVTNDIMVSSPKHPAFERAINLLPVSYSLTWWWAKLQPYAAIMSSTGPLFISLAVADYLYEQPSLPSPTVQVIAPTSLKPYISDLQTATWHGWDAHALKWLSNKPFVWFCLVQIRAASMFSFSRLPRWKPIAIYLTMPVIPVNAILTATLFMSLFVLDRHDESTAGERTAGNPLCQNVLYKNNFDTA
ncbi:uncharacterized protein FIESC28_05411 [Fusarium coffeatum]|uniref:Mannosyl phosphorylinositol ceramide synthase SUR1 n=1 Tax=Fusarium coffeatum TaxID=231269 RepID=A0A366RTK2_9HYPO|nr:uncharacterized protein FIESC28_05411 [Fusarium coffeatum]RBR20132.1 hypothetical protein FIESC28_05411 [Fusarium coffeatum]